MKRRGRIAALSGIVFALTLVGATSATAQLTLYAAAKGEVEGSAPSTLYTLGIADAVAVEIGPIQGPDPSQPGTLHWENVTGLAFLPDGRLVGAASADAILAAGRGSALIEIDHESGAATFIGVIDDDITGVCGRITDLAYESRGQVLYGIGKGCPDDEEWLYSIDAFTGQGTEIGVLDAEVRMGNGLAAEPATTTLYAARTRLQADRYRLELQTVDKETGMATDVQESAAGPMGGLDFDPIGRSLYAVGLDEEEIDPETVELVPSLGTIDTDNARFTRIGITTLGGEDLFGVEAIAFRAPGGCPALATQGCFGPRKSKFSLKASGGKLKWKWSRGTFDEAFLGDPTDDTNYRICVYDTMAPLPGDPVGLENLPLLQTGAGAPAGEGWVAKKKGFKYKSKDGAPEGLTALQIKPGESDGKLTVNGKGVAVPTLPFDQSPAVVVEVQNELGACWQGFYVSPAKKNNEERFDAKFK
jgi:hypothetical protein